TSRFLPTPAPPSSSVLFLLLASLTIIFWRRYFGFSAATGGLHGNYCLCFLCLPPVSVYLLASSVSLFLRLSLSLLPDVHEVLSFRMLDTPGGEPPPPTPPAPATTTAPREPPISCKDCLSLSLSL